MTTSTHGDVFLGIDLGTSSCKVVIAERAGKILARATRTYPLTLKNAGGVEQDPQNWWMAICEATRETLQTGDIDPRRITAIGATGQWSGTVAVGSNGKPLRPAIIWMDTRGAPYIHRLTSGFPGIAGYRFDKLIQWLRKTGGAPAHAGKDSLAHVLYLKHEEPEVYRSTRCFLEPKDYVNLQLTGVFAASWDNVVVTWITDNRDAANIRYDEGLIGMAGLDREKFPHLKASSDIVGKVTAEAAGDLGIPVGVPVVAGAGDMQASLLGSGCVRPNQFHLYVGTSSWLTAHVPYKRTDLSHNIASLPSAIRGLYVIASTQESAGSSLTYVRDLLFGPGDAAPSYEALSALAGQATPAEGRILFAPWPYGERAPVEDRDLRAAFFNLSLSAGRPQLVRTVLEGIAYNTRWMLSPVEKLAGHRAEPIRIGGGGAGSPLWCQIFSDVLDRRIETVAEPAYATARGAAALAALGTMKVTLSDIEAAIPTDRTYTPQPTNVLLYERMYQAFLRYHARTSELYRELNASERSRAHV